LSNDQVHSAGFGGGGDPDTVRQPAGGPSLSLPGLLNILYRGRRTILVVTLLGLLAGLAYSFLTRPLYRATAQVRPGIVAYSDQGGPVREWALKDVVRWFRTRLYWQDLREQEQFKDFKGAPDIMAEFIPSGPQFMQGGDVITLMNLSSDPLLAVATLDEAIKSFNRQASLDSLGSTMYLTIGGARVRMAKISQDMEQLAAEEERVRLNIRQRERELSLVDVKDQTVGFDLERLASENTWRQRAADAARQQAAGARTRLAQAEQMLSEILRRENSDSVPVEPDTDDPVSDVLLKAVSREQAGRVGDLLVTVDELSRTIFENDVKADSLQTRIRANELAMELLKLERDVTLTKEKADIRQEIADLNIQLAHDLPHRRAQLKNDWNAEKVRLDLVSPLERIGRITISEKPVRPRKLRATAILTVLAFFAALFLVLILEYYRNNRVAILAADRN